MKRFALLGTFALACIFVSQAIARADGRVGSVSWSDGRKVSGSISLTTGKTLRLFVGDEQDSIDLDQVKQLVFSPEKEQIFEGFYFPNPGQATQAKTGEVYPIRYLKTDITLADGSVLSGHLVTTVFYLETDDNTEKVVVTAKQTGVDKQKMADLIYPTTILFDALSPNAGTVQLDLGKVALKSMQTPVVVIRPDLAFVALQPQPGPQVWTVQAADPAQLFVSIQAADGFHVGWPAAEPDSTMKQAADRGLKTMQDFYDARETLGCVTEIDAGEIYTLNLLKRAGGFVDGGGKLEHDTPWSLVILRWKYDPGQKKVTLMNRALLGIGREDSNHPVPAVLKEPELQSHLSAIKAATGNSP